MARSPGPGVPCRCRAASRVRRAPCVIATPGYTSAIRLALDRDITVSALAMMKTSAPGTSCREGAFDRLRAVAGVDVAPEVPFALMRVGVERRELGVVLDVHDVGEAQPHSDELRVPAAEVPGHLLLQGLVQRVRRLRPRRVLLVHRRVRRRGLEGEAEHRLARSPHDLLMPAARAAAKTLYVAAELFAKVAAFGASPGPGSPQGARPRRRGRVLVNPAGEHLDHLPVVGQIDQRGTRPSTSRGSRPPGRGPPRARRAHAAKVGDDGTGRACRWRR